MKSRLKTCKNLSLHVLRSTLEATVQLLERRNLCLVIDMYGSEMQVCSATPNGTVMYILILFISLLNPTTTIHSTATAVEAAVI